MTCEKMRCIRCWWSCLDILQCGVGPPACRRGHSALGEENTEYRLDQKKGHLRNFFKGTTNSARVQTLERILWTRSDHPQNSTASFAKKRCCALYVWRVRQASTFCNVPALDWTAKCSSFWSASYLQSSACRLYLIRNSQLISSVTTGTFNAMHHSACEPLNEWVAWVNGKFILVKGLNMHSLKLSTCTFVACHTRDITIFSAVQMMVKTHTSFFDCVQV